MRLNVPRHSSRLFAAALFAAFLNANAQSPANLIGNPEFDLGKAGWTLKKNGTAAATHEATAAGLLSGPNALMVHCTSGGSGPDDIQVFQIRNLQEGRFYHMRFMALSSAPRTIRIGLEESSGLKRTVWQSEDIPLAAGPGRFGPYTFQNRYPDASYKVKFMLGGMDAVDVTIDSVAMNMEDDPDHLREEEKYRYGRHPFQGLDLPYRFFVPEAVGKGTAGTERYPLVFALHGAGERGADNELQLSPQHRLTFAWSDSAAQSERPCFVLAPQCPANRSWVESPWIAGSYVLASTPISAPMAAAVDLLDSLVRVFPVDTSRIYVTGLSMGGYGSFDLILRFPERFAAAVPMSGGGDPTAVDRILGVPVWAFHGDVDSSVPVSGSRDMMSAFEAAGRPVTRTHCYMGSCAADPAAVMDSALAAGAKHLYSEYKGMGHVIWAESYDLAQLQEWVFAQSLDGGAGAEDRGGPDGAGGFTLFPGYPNPFNPSVRIRYSLPADARVKLEVLDALGRRVATLRDGPERAGGHEAVFEAGAGASGTYFFRLEADGAVAVRKAVLAR